MSIQAELFTKDLGSFHTEQKHYLDASGNFLGYKANDGIEALQSGERVKLRFDEETLFSAGCSAINDPTCSMSDPTLEGGVCFVGLSNVNWGRVTQPYQIQGGTLDEPQMYRVKTFDKKDAILRDMVKRQSHFSSEVYDTFYETGELTAPLVKAIEEEDDAETNTESSLLCKGCLKCFATKASLKRHHDRKKSCKDICEKIVTNLSGTAQNIPEKPYIVDWIDELTKQAISGTDQEEKPYCKHCDVEFANKSNLNKHLSKSVACDKLAKQEFIKRIQEICLENSSV